MGDKNQALYLTSRLPGSPGRILEVGSRDWGNTQDFRGHYGGDYVGVDLESGPNVDVVHDLTKGRGPFKPASFDLIICCSVLEHVRQPWVMADTLTNLLRPGGVIYISVPWVWRFHAYPDDYFRFSWRGVESLFPTLVWRDLMFSTYVEGEFFPCEPGADNALALFQGAAPQQRKFLPYLAVNGLGVKPPSSSAMWVRRIGQSILRRLGATP